MSEEQHLLIEAESIKADATIDVAMSRKVVPFVIQRRSRLQRLLRAPRLFAAHYRNCGSLRGAWALTIHFIR